ncbi:hypothetical protein BDA99DRAFT_181248 [Phascolomyces articulosus]|uniref:Uncharacterized protein n=1 Tax=Phascolomyces articulosus TaxID=60185 RepID=A0AAD5PBY1_9FUNG|nr:hypothetical protein BDA99DRAFT_181248 [Phascolomyces articulosus]
MSKPHNPPDHDEAPPPPYAESDNTAYNPAFMNSPSTQHSSSSHHTPLYSPQQPTRYHYQSINVPVHHQYYQGGSVIRRRIVVDPSERGFPIAALFFLFGWFCPPLWVLGACCCTASRNRYEAFWGKANFIMAVMFIISSIVYSMIAITVGDWMVGMRLLNFSVE